ncbi:hypothetical protein EDB19DRAFT_1785465 [Suillus lakei]|nr:hypothetical protein EDB19DRAFT_1785465 [Suillus lakei]
MYAMPSSGTIFWCFNLSHTLSSRRIPFSIFCIVLVGSTTNTFTATSILPVLDSMVHRKTLPKDPDVIGAPRFS